MRSKRDRLALRLDRPDQGPKNDRALNDERFCDWCDLKKSGRAAVGCRKRRPLSAFLADAFDRLMRSVQNQSA